MKKEKMVSISFKTLRLLYEAWHNLYGNMIDADEVRRDNEKKEFPDIIQMKHTMKTIDSIVEKELKRR